MRKQANAGMLALGGLGLGAAGLGGLAAYRAAKSDPVPEPLPDANEVPVPKKPPVRVRDRIRGTVSGVVGHRTADALGRMYSRHAGGGQ
jgi:hypothetical protein